MSMTYLLLHIEERPPACTDNSKRWNGYLEAQASGSLQLCYLMHVIVVVRLTTVLLYELRAVA